ncbi:DUF1129 domain-containing protein [Streptococcus sp. DD13]|uniref:DUF1129 domain-containing protein n=1 Tax=Streptococcus sp. DD13 TaxID=1777881 RepID=UPI000794E165|nr:DUF1129 family protein [Streptococcus sp. DD13]KXT78044.1 Integral membrane protein [Streptococcus sp. DD13]
MSHIELSQFTKKNQEFIHIATNTLIKAGKSDQEIKEALDEILPVILDKQKDGYTARALFGAPTEWATRLLEDTSRKSEAEKNQKNTNPWLMWMDASFFMLALLALMTGAMGFFGQPGTFGLLSLVVMSIGFGGGLYLMYYYVYRHQSGKTGQKPRFWTAIGLVLLVTILWSIISMALVLLPTTINPILDPLVSLILGAATFGLRYYIRKRYNIQSALQTY